jgi:hypothetical protein
MPSHACKTPSTPCSECGADPTEVAANPECGELARALHKRGRTTHVFPLGNFFGLGAKPMHAVAMQILSVGDEGEARDDAHKTRAEQSKRAGDGRDEARKDPSGLAAESNMEALMRACRMVDEKGLPTRFPAFSGVGWMRRELSTDQQALLLALYDELKRKHGPHPIEIDAETVDAIAKVLQEHAGEDLPEAYLAPYPRTFLTHFAVMLAVRLGQARLSVEVLLEEREAWERERAELQAQLEVTRARAPVGEDAPPAAAAEPDTIEVEPLEDGDGWTVESVTAGEVDKADFRGPRAEEQAKLFANMLRTRRGASLVGAPTG